MSTSRIASALLLYMVCFTPVRAQSADTVRLGALWARALQTDPRQGQLELNAMQSELRQLNLAATRYPSFTIEGLAQHQSDVPAIGLNLPGGQRPPGAPHNTYDARVAIQQSLYDPTLAPRRAVERAQLAENEARVRVALFGLREEVSTAFFTAALLQERALELATVIDDLEARLRETVIRVRERTALPSDASTLEATLLQRRQDLAELQANRQAAVRVLNVLTGQQLTSNAVLDLPNTAAAFAAASQAAESIRARPEYAQFTSTRERLDLQSAALEAQEKPRVSAFGRAGYGRPGLKFITDDFDEYWLAGVQVQWTPWNWGRVRRERAELELQRRIVTTEEEAFAQRIRRALENDLAAVDRLAAALEMDDQIIRLREQIEREARVRLDERVLTTAEYTERRNDLAEARLARARHRVELAQAQAHFLNLLGLEVR